MNFPGYVAQALYLSSVFLKIWEELEVALQLMTA